MKNSIKLIVIYAGLILMTYGYTDLRGQSGVGKDDRLANEYCEGETFNASCRPGYVVLVTKAVYGRMRRGRCVGALQDTIGCSTDVLPHLDWRCSGRNSCRLPVTDLLQVGTRPCPMDYRSYLETNFKCVPVVQDSADGSCTIRLSQPTSHTSSASVTSRIEGMTPSFESGYVSSYMTSQIGCGTVDRPWLLRADQGHRIRLTLYDFSSPVVSLSRAERISSTGTVCLVHAVVREPTAGGQTRTVCGGRTVRDELVMVSAGSELDLRLVGKKLSQAQPTGGTNGDSDNVESFMIKYQLLGCSDPPLPGGAWLKRQGNQAQIGCGNTLLWQLGCIGDESNGYTWSKQLNVSVTCESAALMTSLAASADVLSTGISVTSLFRGTSVLILALVSMVVGLLVLLLGLVYFSCRRRSEAHVTTQSNSPGVTAGPSSLHHSSILYPRVAPSKKCHQLLLHCDIGLPTRYIGTTSDICRPTTMGSLPWNIDRDVTTTSESGDVAYSTSLEHIYESPSFLTKTRPTGGALNNTTSDSNQCAIANCKVFSDAVNCDEQINIV